MRELGATAVLATNAVGSIAAAMAPGDLVVPHQIIDYTWGRLHTYMDTEPLRHVDFTSPYDATLRDRLRVAAAALELDCTVFNSGVYGATQGPRLESAAEIDRMARDGCDIVGMTGMPEAGLARELDLPYAAICLVVNLAAGRGDGPIAEGTIGRIAAQGMNRIERLVARFVESGVTVATARGGGSAGGRHGRTQPRELGDERVRRQHGIDAREHAEFGVIQVMQLAAAHSALLVELHVFAYRQQCANRSRRSVALRCATGPSRRVRDSDRRRTTGAYRGAGSGRG